MDSAVRRISRAASGVDAGAALGIFKIAPVRQLSPLDIASARKGFNPRLEETNRGAAFLRSIGFSEAVITRTARSKMEMDRSIASRDV